jgi:hypothetical protein
MTDQKPDDVMAREEARRAHDRATGFIAQVNEAAIKTGESTFQACLLINGGAAVSSAHHCARRLGLAATAGFPKSGSGIS